MKRHILRKKSIESCGTSVSLSQCSLRAERIKMKKVLYEGPDISRHNGNVDIKSVRDAGYKRIGIRAGYGKNNVDQKYGSNALACHNLGVNVLLYWFSYAYNVPMAAAEAEFAVSQAAKYWKKCPIAFDFEYDSVNYARNNGVRITEKLATDMAIAFLKGVKEAGYIPVLYTNRDYLQNYFDLNRITAETGRVYVWYARYIADLRDGEGDIDIWQYTSTAKIPGIRGNTDLNRFYTEFADDVVKPDQEKKININVLDFQTAANLDGFLDAHGNRLAEDGKDGPGTQYVRRNINLKAKKSGKSFVTGSHGHVVKWWQRRCNEILGWHQEIDGRYGERSRADTIALQKRLNLKADGIAWYNSIQAAFYH